MKYVIGIDPGHDGGIALHGFDQDNEVMVACAMPTRPIKKDKRTIDIPVLKQFLLTTLPGFHSVSLVLIEEVVAMRKKGEQAQGAVSMLTFGKGAGKILGAFEWEAVPLQEINSKVWKNKILAGTSKDKEAAINFVRARFPALELKKPRGRVFHNGMADAVCIALHARQLLLSENNLS